MPVGRLPWTVGCDSGMRINRCPPRLKYCTANGMKLFNIAHSRMTDYGRSAVNISSLANGALEHRERVSNFEKGSGLPEGTVAPSAPRGWGRHRILTSECVALADRPARKTQAGFPECRCTSGLRVSLRKRRANSIQRYIPLVAFLPDIIWVDGVRRRANNAIR
jgi:hypothetical protein